jgi:PKD repeat protein
LIGCYSCHKGPGNDSINTNAPPSVANVSTTTSNDKPVAMTLSTSGVPLRIISQPANGSIGLSGATATYFPSPGFVGIDTFTFAAYDGSKNSNLATGSVNVAQGPFSIGATAHVPPSYPAGWPAPFAVVPTITNQAAAAAFEWDFGDGSARSTNQYASHSFAASGGYIWTVISRVSTVSVTNSGIISIGGPMRLASAAVGSSLVVSWPANLAGVVVEQSPSLGAGAIWIPATNIVYNGTVSVSPAAVGSQFFRLRQVQ